MSDNSITSIPDADLLKRTVKSARHRSFRKGSPHPRWTAVMDVFLLGSTFARELCCRFDLDPDEKVKR